MPQHQGALALANSTSSLTIDSIAIRELDGLFSLNDLHKAGGSKAKDRPNYFLANEKTQALIVQIEQGRISGIAMKAIHGGSNPGTYACRELVIAYAAWISAAFHLKVIRVFLATTAPKPTDLTSTLEHALNTGNWFLSVSNGRLTLQPVASNAYVITAEQFADIIREPGQVSPKLLPEIISAAAERLRRINQDTR